MRTILLRFVLCGLLSVSLGAPALLFAQATQSPSKEAPTAPVTAPKPRPRPDEKPIPEPTRYDMLRGAYGPFRANNDLLYYHLDIRVDPGKQWVSGKNTIRFRMLKDGMRIQMDLRDTLTIDKILLGDDAAEVRAGYGRGICGFPADAACRAGLLDRFLLFRASGRDGAVWRDVVQERSGRPDVDLHGLRGDGREHVVAGQGPMARRG